MLWTVKKNNGAAMNIPPLDLKRQYKTIKDEVGSALARVCDEQTFILGKPVEDFEKAIATFCGVKHAIGV
ncbi:MAG: DegT/DnrJ/EryC1/StrS family aminotransferase, partial [Candidatus Omnitrophica bacterium]|nr:DegT/DnrJ/EryC1/StrS family aminotransferase [Candidatus Omnitrophota bacterium]